jgi:hypothetical protein
VRDTHNFAFGTDRLVRVKLEADIENPVDDDLVELAQGGLLADRSQLIDREDAPGIKYCHFIQDGDLKRRIRDAETPTETLTTGNATAQSISPDLSRIVYLDSGSIGSVSAVAQGEPIVIIPDVGNAQQLRASFAPDSSEVAVVISGNRLARAPLDRADASSLVDEAAVAEVGYNAVEGAAARLLWLSGSRDLRDQLRAAPLGDGPAVTLVDSGASAWLPIAGSADVLVVRGGALERLTP